MLLHCPLNQSSIILSIQQWEIWTYFNTSANRFIVNTVFISRYMKYRYRLMNFRKQDLCTLTIQDTVNLVF